MVLAFTVYVRPLLQYASYVWSPLLLKDIKHIESVQKRFTKRLVSMADLDYSLQACRPRSRKFRAQTVAP